VATLEKRIDDLERNSAGKVDVVGILIAGRENARLGLPRPPSLPVIGNSPTAKAVRAARLRLGLSA
jgi:hypothetical protein